jgi:hypothetical protein
MQAPRALRSLGLGKFLDEYDFWAKMPGYDEAIEYQIQKNISNEVGAIRRTYAAKKIFSDPELLRSCLIYAVEHATKTSVQQREVAQKHLAALRL